MLATGEEEDIETFMKRSQLWYNRSDALGPLNLGMDHSWIRQPQQRSGMNVSSSQYSSLATAAFQEFRTRDPSKGESLSNAQILYRQQQQAQSQQQQSHLLPHMNDVTQLQLAPTQTQTSIGMGSYQESELQMSSPSPRSFSMQGMMSRGQGNGPVSSSDGSQFSNLMRANPNGLQPCNQVNQRTLHFIQDHVDF